MSQSFEENKSRRAKRSSSVTNKRVETFGDDSARDLVIEANSIPKMDFEIFNDELIIGSRYIIHLLFPGWEIEKVIFSEVKSGITNKLVLAEHEDLKMLIRVYGKDSDLLIDRGQEMKNICRLAELKISPGAYGSFVNGFVYGYIAGDVLNPNDISTPDISRSIARKLSEWHKIELTDTARVPLLFSTLKKWLKVSNLCFICST